MKKILKNNLDKINKTINDNKKVADVKTVVVTKYVDADIIRALYELGIRDFGENRADALVEKQNALADINDDINWHFIGRLQTRPVRKIIDKFDYLHSLDRPSLAKELQKRAQEKVKCFLQVNVSGEEAKTGINPTEIHEVIEDISQYDKIEIIGLMTMAPFDASEDELHEIFKTMRKLRDDVQSHDYTHAPCTDLSMGMSHDYKIALQEGATCIRIGSKFYEGLNL